jgi:3-deoxy-D-manno-octulosonate 8-phosphate phosphatase (KDO 8-P phosphatase)
LARKRLHRAQLKAIKLLLLDVDGVMTDGSVYIAESGDRFKKFNIQDGFGIVRLLRSGVKVGIITGGHSTMVQRRADELGISDVFQNFDDKILAYEKLKSKYQLTDEQIAHMGDDELDLPLMERAGFSAAPADAVPLVRKKVHYVCKRRGGEGAVREVIELLLQGRVDGGW